MLHSNKDGMYILSYYMLLIFENACLAANAEQTFL